jgi:hypothetical protein
VSTLYVVVPAPGCYGDRAAVLSAHRSAKAAVRAAKGSRWIARESTLPAGATWLRVYEQTSREVQS